MVVHNALTTAELRKKRVIIRFDGDVPLHNGKITDDNRLRASLPTIKYCLNNGAKVLLICHMGRPTLPKPEPELSTKILIPFFEQELGQPVRFMPDHEFQQWHDSVILMENLRFSQGEEKNNPGFAKLLASLGDVYVNDAMAVIHRDHASIVGLPKLLPYYLGLHIEAEIKALNPLLDNPHRPYTVLLAGAKASDKSPIVADLADKVDYILIGGLVAVTYLVAMGQKVGGHDLDKEQIKLARHCIKEMNRHHAKFILPSDIVTSDNQVKSVTEWGKDDIMLDIGPKTREIFDIIIDKSNTLFWNGAMGKFEDPAFAAGTLAVARSMAKADADVKIASGGDTVSAIHQFKLEKGFTFISTGGGATLEYIAGRELPGLEALEG